MEANNRGILKNKIFLYLTEFFAGMSVPQKLPMAS